MLIVIEIIPSPLNGRQVRLPSNRSLFSLLEKPARNDQTYIDISACLSGNPSPKDTASYHFPERPMQILINIGQKAITQCQRLTRYFCHLLSVVPELRIGHIPMHTHQWQEDRSLEPPGKTFVKTHIRILCLARTKKASGIVRPPKQTAD